MSKHDNIGAALSNRQKRLAKKARKAEMPELAPAKRKGSNWREVKEAKDPCTPALNARCIRFGLAPNRTNRRIVSGAHMSCEIGFVMEARLKDADVSRLWSVWQAWCSAERTYRVRILGVGDGPQCSAVPMLPEDMQTDQSATVDVRSDDERNRDAVNGWMRWRGFVGHLSAQERAALNQARTGDGPALWSAGKPTAPGLFALHALSALADIAEKA